MKNLKVLCAIILSAAVMASLAGCSKDDKKEETTAETTTSAIAAAEEVSKVIETTAATESEETEPATEWMCENCGAFGNKGAFCNECGEPAPDSFVVQDESDGSGDSSARPTIMPYETEEQTYDEKGKNEIQIANLEDSPIICEDPATGLTIEVNFAATISYDVLDGVVLSDEQFQTTAPELAAVRLNNVIAYYSFSNIDANKDVLEEGLAFDLRQGFSVFNVSVEFTEISLTEASQIAYDEATGN